MPTVSLYKWQTATSFRVKVLAVRQAAVCCSNPMVCSNEVAGCTQLAKGTVYFKDKRFPGRGQLHTSSIALEGALVEVVASSQHSLQEVDEPLAGTHLLAPHL